MSIAQDAILIGILVLVFVSFFSNVFSKVKDVAEEAGNTIGNSIFHGVDISKIKASKELFKQVCIKAHGDYIDDNNYDYCTANDVILKRFPDNHVEKVSELPDNVKNRYDSSRSQLTDSIIGNQF